MFSDDLSCSESTPSAFLLHILIPRLLFQTIRAILRSLREFPGMLCKWLDGVSIYFRKLCLDMLPESGRRELPSWRAPQWRRYWEVFPFYFYAAATQRSFSFFIKNIHYSDFPVTRSFKKLDFRQNPRTSKIYPSTTKPFQMPRHRHPCVVPLHTYFVSGPYWILS